MLLDIRTRQSYLKALGFYGGRIDGKEGAKTKAAYLALQKKYFSRLKDRDGLYGNNTDILLRNAYKCSKLEHFKLTEFKCHCGGKYCTGYPAELDDDLLNNLEKVRAAYREPIKIKSGIRCAEWNKRQTGSSTNSRHKLGKAADLYISGITTNDNGRKKLIIYWYTLKNARYAYGNIGGSHPNMGASVHVDVK